MKPKIYVETTVISYLTALPSTDLIMTAHQQITRDWWKRRQRFDLFISQAVLREVAAGNTEAATLRLAAVDGIPVLTIGTDTLGLAERFLFRKVIPTKAEVAAVHIAVAVVNGMDFLVIWNCAHIANAAIRGKIEETCRDMGFEPPTICTPEELLEEST
ncbi:MAG: type II toxin-antitoxin system VapC family toxin [Terriglobia bacterium]